MTTTPSNWPEGQTCPPVPDDVVAPELLAPAVEGFATPETLDAFYDIETGEPFEGTGIPQPGEFIDLPQQKLHDHPFMWALDVFVFAGPEAHEATTRYQQGQAVSQMAIHVYRILSTTDGVMHLLRAL